MSREFVPFDEEAIDREFAALGQASDRDFAKLAYCIQLYESLERGSNPNPAIIQSFESGILELRHFKGEYKGRLLFYVPELPKGTPELVMLVVFRKQTQKTPLQIVALAEQRMKLDRAARRAKDKE